MATEIEMRARFDAATHDRLIAYLEQHGEDLGGDDKHIYFYVLPDKLLKVVDNLTAGTAKISLKGSKIGQGAAFPELELPIRREDAGLAVRIFNALGLEGSMHDAFNRRRNFRYRGVEIAVKWSQAWGHHAEFEVLLDDMPTAAQQAEAVERIRSVAEEVGVRLMSEQELAEFVRAFEEAQAAKARG
jgi:adenylate cyclase class IV